MTYLSPIIGYPLIALLLIAYYKCICRLSYKKFKYSSIKVYTYILFAVGSANFAAELLTGNSIVMTSPYLFSTLCYSAAVFTQLFRRELIKIRKFIIFRG